MAHDLGSRLNPEWFDESTHPHIDIELRPYTFTEICNLYNVKRRAMQTMMAPFAGKVGKPAGQYYTVRQLEIIFNLVGPPYKVVENRSVHKK